MFLPKKLLWMLGFAGVMFAPVAAHAENIVDALNLAPFVPMVLDAFMMVATGGYEFFVGDGSGHIGIIYVLVWGFLAITIGIGLAKMYIPKKWLGFVGVSGGGEIADGKMTGFKVVEHVAKPGLRAVVAAVLLLQLRPVFLTQWLVNPFLELGAIYTHQITESINETGMAAPTVECPADIVEKAWISQESCEFLVQPVSDLSHANNQIVKRGFDFVSSGLRGLMTPIPHGGQDFMNLITGIILIFTFVGSNLFMALLIIQAIFNFGMQLILYPFYVLTYVMKPNDKWFDVWPAFSGVTKALQDLIVTMIACAFILCINLAIIKALFSWNRSVFVVAAGGSAASNIPTHASSAGAFGEHSIMWLSSILTLYLMFKIFNMTRDQLRKYTSVSDGLYKSVISDTKTFAGSVKNTGKQIGTAIGWIKGK